jgi:hypothetical protein
MAEPATVLGYVRGDRYKGVLLSQQEAERKILASNTRPGSGERFRDRLVTNSMCPRCEGQEQLEGDYLCEICRYGVAP